MVRNLNLIRKQNSQPVNLIKETTEKLLKIMGFSGRVEIETSQPESIIINIVTDQASFLIGQGGINLFAFQHLIRLIISKKLKSETRHFILDVNNYRQHRVQLLKELALSKANQAIQEKKPIALEPMSSYERRIIHLELSSRDDVVCQSEEEGDKRHIVIKPTPWVSS